MTFMSRRQIASAVSERTSWRGAYSVNSIAAIRPALASPRTNFAASP